jgi:hypothetical protein
MILVDLDESYQNILKSFHVARKKVPLLWGQKSCFFSIAPKRHLDQSILAKGYQNHYRMTIHDLPFVKNGGQKINFFRFLVF